MSEFLMPEFEEHFVQNVERVLAHVAVNGGGDLSQCFPTILRDAYSNALGDAIVVGCAMEIAEGNDAEETPPDVGIAEHAVRLMERVRDDISRIISALGDYTPDKADAIRAGREMGTRPRTSGCYWTSSAAPRDRVTDQGTRRTPRPDKSRTRWLAAERHTPSPEWGSTPPGSRTGEAIT